MCSREVVFAKRRISTAYSLVAGRVNVANNSSRFFRTIGQTISLH